jgi:hypothetical protein
MQEGNGDLWADLVKNEDYYVEPGERIGAVRWGTAYKPAGRGFDSRCGYLDLLFTYPSRPGIGSASNRNEY